jgi:DNA-binding transcriptional ArsR family regulator
MEEESNLIRFFGNNPFTRILDVLIDNIGESYSKKELQELAGISKAAFFIHWPKVEELNLVTVTREIGKTKLFALNKNNKFVKDILKFEMRMIEGTTLKKVAIATA